MSMSDISIREAAKSDEACLLALYAQPSFNGRSLDPDRAGTIFATMRDYPFYRPYVAEVEGRVVGTFCLLVLENPAHLGTPIAMLENVVVADDMQGKGIGKIMMNEAGRISTEEGAYKLILATGLKRSAAHEFYENLGFERYGYSYGLPLRESQP